MIIFLLLALPVMTFMVFSLLAYMAVNDAKIIARTFPKSRVVSSYCDILGQGTFSNRCTVILISTGAVMWPGKHIAKGDLLTEELDSLPKGVLIRMRWLMGSVIWVCAWLGGLLVYGKYFK